MRSKHIAIFLHDLNIGGAQRVMLKLAEGFVKSGARVDLVLLCANGALLIEVPNNVRLIDFGTHNYIKAFNKLVYYLVVNRPDALLSPFEVTSIMAICAKLLTRVKTKISVRVSVNLSAHKRSSAWKKCLEQKIVSFLYNKADNIIAVSQGVRNDLENYASIPEGQIQVIYNPIIDSALVEKSMLEIQHRFWNPKIHPVVLGVGRLTEQKDFFTLIRSFAKINENTPSKLLILGEGEDRSALQALINELEMQDVVDLYGYDDNPYKYMKGSDVFVLSSKWEGLPNVLIQSMACGCPVISTDCPSGPREILNNGSYGYLIPVGDVDRMAEAIINTLQEKNPPFTTEWLDQFSVERVVKKYLEVL